MGGGGQQQNQEHATLEDRIFLLERKIPIYLERISRYDQVAEDLVKQVDDFNKLVVRMDDQESCSEIDCKKVETSIAYLSDQQKSLSSAIVAQSSASDLLKASHMSLDDSLDQCEQRMIKLIDAKKAEVVQAMNSKADAKDLEGHKQLSAQMYLACDMTRQQLVPAVDALRQDLQVSRLAISNLQDDVRCVQSELSDALVSVAAQKNAQDRFQQLLDKAYNDLVIQMDKKIADFRLELSQDSSPVSALRDDLQKKMDLVALDGTNSTIRSQKSEQKMMILEKKIENLYLLMQKI